MHVHKLNEFLNNQIELIFKGKEKYRICKEFHEKDIEIFLDQTYFPRVLLNIFMNSIQAMPEGGKIYVRTYNSVYISCLFFHF